MIRLRGPYSRTTSARSLALLGVGKTVLGTCLIAKRARNTLILVHRKPLLDQWVAQLAIGEGFDDARLDTLFLALPISWKGTLTQ